MKTKKEIENRLKELEIEYEKNDWAIDPEAKGDLITMINELKWILEV